MGQPGVYAAAEASQWYNAGELFGCCQFFDIAVDSAALITGEQLGLEAYLTSRVARIKSVGSGLPRFARNLNAQGGVRIRQGVYSPVSPHPNARITENRMQWLERRLGNGSLVLSEPGAWSQLMNYEVTPFAGRLGFAVEEFKVGEAFDGGTIGFFFDAGWQLAQDWGNPYLSTSNKLYRAGIAGGVGFVAGLGVAAIVGTGPVSIAVAVGVGWILEAPISNLIFQNFGLTPTRKLSPLSN